jgi:hypothetical protein
MPFAFKTANEHNSWTEILPVWLEADGIDLFEAGWLFDHFYPLRSTEAAPDLSGPCLEGWGMLSGLAQATQRLRLGIPVSAMPYRHPPSWPTWPPPSTSSPSAVSSSASGPKPTSGRPTPRASS